MSWFIGMSDADISAQTLAYTVDAAYEARITVEFTNRSTSASATASLWVVPAGEGVANEHIKESGTTLGLAGTPQAVLVRRVIAPAGSKVYVQASSANVSCQLSGDVVSPDNTASALTTAITAATLATAITYTPSGTGAVSRTLSNRLDDSIHINNFLTAAEITDAKTGAPSTNMTTNLQKAFDAALAAGAPLVVDDTCTYLTTTGIVCAGFVNLIGAGRIKTAAEIPLITYAINAATVNYWFIDGPTFVGPSSTNTSSCAIRITGNNTTYLQHGYCRCTATNFNAFLKDEKTARTTAFGLEAMLNWNEWDVSLHNQGSYGFWYTQGSGTGSTYRGKILTRLAASAAWFFDGSGCVVGDVIFSGIQLGCEVAGGIGVKIGASTEYRSQWSFTGVQFDANCDIPISLSGTGSVTYKGWNLSGIAWGGNAELGAGLQPLYGSIVDDSETSRWSAGNAKTSATVGAISQNVFTIDFASWGACRAKVYASGLIGSVSACSSYTEFEIREGSGSLTRTYIESYIGVTNGFDVTVSVSGTIATVTVACTSAGSGTTYNATIQASGNGFKITRS